MDEFAPAEGAGERPLYRDERHLVFWDGAYYVLYDMYTRERRYYADARDVFRRMMLPHEATGEPA
jgi:hypothetical protein